MRLLWREDENLKITIVTGRPTKKSAAGDLHRLCACRIGSLVITRAKSLLPSDNPCTHVVSVSSVVHCIVVPFFSSSGLHTPP